MFLYLYTCNLLHAVSAREVVAVASDVHTQGSF